MTGVWLFSCTNLDLSCTHKYTLSLHLWNVNYSFISFACVHDLRVSLSLSVSLSVWDRILIRVTSRTTLKTLTRQRKKRKKKKRKKKRRRKKKERRLGIITWGRGDPWSTNTNQSYRQVTNHCAVETPLHIRCKFVNCSTESEWSCWGVFFLLLIMPSAERYNV